VGVFSLFPGDTGVGAAACRISAATVSTRADSRGAVHDSTTRAARHLLAE
jgi:hypothetical protein